MDSIVAHIGVCDFLRYSENAPLREKSVNGEIQTHSAYTQNTGVAVFMFTF